METALKRSSLDTPLANRTAATNGSSELCRSPSYAKDLRVVGQMLESRDVITADLVLVADTYIIQGRMKAAPRSSSLLSLFNNWTKPIKSRTVTLRRRLEDIAEFDSRARCFRTKVNGMPDPYALSQILRSAGAYLDTRKGSSLIGIMLGEKKMTIRFETGSGGLEEMSQDIHYFYDYWVKMYQRRNKRIQLDSLKDEFLPSSLWNEIQRGSGRRAL